MESLPDEIIQQILTDSKLSFVDVVHFSSVCFKFREMVNLNRSLWKAKYFQRWPKTDFKIVCEDWYNECISRVHFEKQAQQLLSDMSARFLHLDRKKIGTSQLDFILHFINSYKTQSLTDKYYGNIIMKYIHKKHNREIWYDLMQLSVTEQTLEKGAIFVTIWHQEYERGLWKRIISELDDTASKVRSHLLQIFPHHPLKDTPEETRLRWKNENIPGNFFGPEDSEAVISAINHVLFEDLKYCVSYDCNELYKNKSGIDFALLDRKANPYTFAVIYESIARRLGVKTEILEFSDDCLLRWKMDYSVINSPSRYIKRSNDGIFRTFLPEKFCSDELIEPCNMLKVAERAASFIHPRELGDRHISLRDALELELVIKPFSLECYQQLSQTYMLHELDAKELILKLKDIRGQISNAESREFQSLLHSLELHQQIWEQNHSAVHQQARVQNRVEGIDFAVGMIVRDKFWEVVGVIHGWNINLMTPKKGLPKVHYNVLVEDGRYECTPQENLQILHSPPFISHPCIGRFFDKYCLTYYRPNKDLQAQYPQDLEALQKILKKDRLN